MKRNRKLYAARRMSLAIDRVIAKRGDIEKARLWAHAWAVIAQVRQSLGSTGGHHA